MDSYTPKAYVIYTEEGSRFVARFDPILEDCGILYGRATIVGYSEAAGKDLRIIGVAPEPEPGGRIVINDVPVSSEVLEGEVVHTYEYETIDWVDDVSHMVEGIECYNDQVKEEAY